MAGHGTAENAGSLIPPAPAAAAGAEYVTVAQAAAILGCSPKQVRRLIESGRIRAIDVGTARQRSYRIRRVDLEVGLAVPPPAQVGPPRRRRRLAEIRYIPRVI